MRTLTLFEAYVTSRDFMQLQVEARRINGFGGTHNILNGTDIYALSFSKKRRLADKLEAKLRERLQEKP